ncbi:MAG TPA: branched-chain amino acid ABC transporter permease [Bradyrhizobium sp.]|nr:branched-chain amino acid ABC transporter permease [Bradyrhizobium sp.]
MKLSLTPRNFFVVMLLALLALLPVYSALTGNTFMVTLFTRIVILAIAAVSLNLIMGFGGMVSFGHAAYLGIGGYVIGILAKEGIGSGFIQWPLALVVSGLFALGVGALSLRTRGVYFIMITLAFAQMVYYVANGLDRYGGDDGLTIQRRSDFGGLMNLSNRTFFYYFCLVLLLATVYLVWRMVNSRFGLVIQGARSNERRMRAIGFPTFRYKLTCFVIAGVLCGLSGVLLANHTNFISPALMHWTRSGDLIVMAVLGGMGTVFGPVIGAVALLVLEETLPHLIGFASQVLTGKEVVAAKEYWQLILGPMLLLVVIYARGGIEGLVSGRRRG